MEENKKLVYFTVDNWSPGIDYPRSENFDKLYDHEKDTFVFIDDEYCKENKLAATYSILDMSTAHAVVAPMDWVMKNCPEIIGSYWDETDKPGKNNWEESIYDLPYLEYKEENFGSVFVQYNKAGEPVLQKEDEFDEE